MPTVDPLVEDQNEDRTTATPGVTTPTASPTESPTATCSYFTQTFTVLEPPVCTPPPQDEATTTAATTTGRRSKGTSGCGGGYKGSSRRGVTGFEEAFTALWGGQDAFIDQANYGLELSDFMADDVTVMTGERRFAFDIFLSFHTKFWFFFGCIMGGWVRGGSTFASAQVDIYVAAPMFHCAHHPCILASPC